MVFSFFCCFFFFFFLRPCSLTFHHSYRGRHPRLFSYGNIYLFYISIFCKSHKVRQAQLVRRENTHAKGFRFLFIPATWIRFVPVAGGSWLGGGRKKKKRKKDAFKKDKVERRALFFSLSLLPPLPPLCPPSLPAVELQIPFSRVQPPGQSWALATLRRNQGSGCLAAALRKKK